MRPSAVSINAADNLWCVKLPNGDVRAMNLDRLDVAYQKGEVDEGTLLLADGRSTWVPLGELAQIGESSAKDEAAKAARKSKYKSRLVAFVAVALASTAAALATMRPFAKTPVPPPPMVEPTELPERELVATAGAGVKEVPPPRPEKRRVKGKKRPKARDPSASAPAETSAEESPFHRGGDPHDPLNEGI